MAKKKVGFEKKTIVIMVLIFSIFLYLAGVFSGLYANKVLEAKTKEDLESLKQETKKNIEFFKEETKENLDYMEQYVSFLDQNLRDVQLDQIFLETLNQEERCRFLSITTKSLFDQLNIFWKKLPFRLESYEKNNPLTEDYLILKKQYMQLSIKAWIITNNLYQKCETDILPVLYFYSTQCDSCIKQGEELDLLRLDEKSQKNIIVYTIDFDYDEPIIRHMKDFYSISSVPALVIDNTVMQGRAFSKEEIEDKLK